MPIIHLILDGDNAFFDLQGREADIIHRTAPFTVAALARGMKSGHPSLAIRVDLPDNKVLIQETSVAAWLAVARALEGKYARKLNRHSSQGKESVGSLEVNVGTPEDVAAEKYFTPPEPDKELESLIRFWKDSLAQHRLLMSPATVYLVEQTIKSLEELKKIKEG